MLILCLSPSAPVYDSTRHTHVGMLSVTDFIEILLHYYNEFKQAAPLSAVANARICDWQSVSLCIEWNGAWIYKLIFCVQWT